MPWMAAQERNALEHFNGNGGPASPEEADALLRVAALAANSGDRDDGPSKSMVGMLVALGFMLVALVLLAVLLSAGTA